MAAFFSENGRLDREIETWCQKANTMTYQLSPLLLHPKIKMEIKKTDNIYNFYTNTLLPMSNMVFNSFAAEENRYM